MNLSYLFLSLNIIFIILMSTIDVEFLLDYRLYRYDAYFHLIMYMIFSFISMMITYKKKRFSLLVFIFIFPFLTEYVQYFLPTRSVDIKDLSNNYYGIIFGIILFIIFKYVKKN